MRDSHNPERGHVVLDDEQRAEIEAAGHPPAVDYARWEGTYLVTYWGAPCELGREHHQGSTSICPPAWQRGGAQEGGADRTYSTALPNLR